MANYYTHPNDFFKLTAVNKVSDHIVNSLAQLSTMFYNKEMYFQISRFNNMYVLKSN